MATRGATSATPATGSTTLTGVPLPGDQVAGQTLLELQVVSKPFDAPVSTPTGWTLRGEEADGTNAVGAGDTGSVRCTTFTREYQTGDAAPNVSIPGGNCAVGAITSYHKDNPSSTWDIADAGGTVRSATAGWSDGDIAIPMAPGDWVSVNAGFMSDSGATGVTGLTFSADTVTFDAGTEVYNWSTTTGADTRSRKFDAKVAAASPSATEIPLCRWTQTNNINHQSQVIRIREVAPAGGVTGTGSLLATAATIAAAGTLTLTGTGGLGAQPATLTGTGTLAATGIGSLTAAPATVTGTGTLVATGTGGLDAPAATLAGAGTATLTGSGALTAPPGTLAGTGAVVSGVAGTGALTAPPAALNGSGTLSLTGNSTLASPAASLAGSAAVTLTGSGDLPAIPATLAAAGWVALTGTGTLDASPADLIAAGTVGEAGPFVELLAAHRVSDATATRIPEPTAHRLPPEATSRRLP